jgi:hypothetical protein
MNSYISPQINLNAFNCPHCGAFANQLWYYTVKVADISHLPNNISAVYRGNIEYIKFAECAHCKKHSIWHYDNMIFPFSGNAPLPNPDLPDNIKSDYEEAKNIVSLSPRGSVALLRLAIQKLCKHLGESGKNINDDIGNLVKKGLPATLQKALDSVRVIGNNAVHPGQIDLKDDIETAIKLFNFVNIICDAMITQPKKIAEFYDEKLPEDSKKAIEKRDSK